MEELTVLIIVPLIIALLQLVIREERLARIVTCVGAVLTAVVSIYVGAVYLGGDGVQYITLDQSGAHLVGLFMLAIDVVLAAVVVVMSYKYKRVLPVILVVIQLGIALWYEFALPQNTKPVASFGIDGLSVILILIVGILGSALAVYSLGYMRDHHAHHPEQNDRRPWFMFLVFAFLSAMFMLALANDFMWFFAAWEITTVASFLLIAYTKEEQAINNAFRQIILNTIGGIALIVGIAGLGIGVGVHSFQELFALNRIYMGFIQFPIFCFVLAGMVKAAQMPFQSWLLGAMVAPTPVSALLHSSTMVKAGVFLVIKMAPLFTAWAPGALLAMIGGGLSFLICSVLAISQSNAKLVLAYSTIANLGLIIACAGTGSAAALWAAVFLMIFHAVAKSLLFICVGSTEHRIGSRDIESMDGLLARLPQLSVYMIIGIFGMFVAPFGMLVSKWAALEAFIMAGQIPLIVFVMFGSAATFFFWIKWLAKLCRVAANAQSDHEERIHRSEWFAIRLCAALTLALTALLPLISQSAVIPYINGVAGALPVSLTHDPSLGIMVAMLIILGLTLFVFSRKKDTRKKLPIYMAGENLGDDKHYKGSMAKPVEISARNWYLDEFIHEKRLSLAGNAVSLVLIGFCLVLGLVPIISLISRAGAL